MDKLILHPKAHDCLFQHYRALRNIFHDVLGHLELDYLSITLINPDNELLFFSSRPSLELNLIELDLWQHDPILCLPNTQNDECLIWNDIYQDGTYFKLKHYKMEKTQIYFGFSTLSHYQDFKVIYSFGLFSQEVSLEQRLMKNIETLKAMGKFCLQNILEVFTKDAFVPKTIAQKRHLYVVKPQSDIIY